MDRRSILSEIRGDLGICGCGSPSEAYEAVHKLLLALQKSSKPSRDWGDWHDLIDNNPYALILAYLLDNEEYIEHGTSIRHPWLTDKGLKLIDALNTLQREDDYDFCEDKVYEPSEEEASAVDEPS